MLKRRRTEQDELLARTDAAPLVQPRPGVKPRRAAASPVIAPPEAFAEPYTPERPRPRKRRRSLLLVIRPIAVLLLFGVGAYFCLPFVLKADRYRPLVEDTMTRVLGRQVRVGSLAFTLGLGGLVATDVSVAEERSFGARDFAHVRQMKLGIERLALFLGGRIEVSSVDLTEPSITAVRDAAGHWNLAGMLVTGTPLGGAAPRLRIRDGVVTIRGGATDEPLILRGVAANFPTFSTAAEMTFTLSAAVEGGGTMTWNGRAGPVLWNRGSPGLPMSVLVNARKVALAGSKLTSTLAPGLDGTLNFDGTVESDGKSVTVTGNMQIAKLRLARRAEPYADPVRFALTVQHDLDSGSGEIRRGELRFGKGSVEVKGGYAFVDGRTAAKATIDAHGVPAAPLGSLLEAAGIPLPSGTSLQDGVAFLDLNVEGPVARPTVAGTVTLNNAKLAGFDLADRLQSVSGLEGLHAGRDLQVEAFTAAITSGPDGIHVGHVEAALPEVGTLTGEGTISDDRTLDFRMQAVRDGAAGRLPIPFVIRGDCASPVFRQPGKTN